MDTRVKASETTNDQNQTNEEQDYVQPLTDYVVIRKDLGIAKIPLLTKSGVIVYEVSSNRSDFYAEYENGMLYLQGYNLMNYMDNSDVLVTFSIKGNDANLAPFEEEIKTVIHIESKITIEEILQKENSVDTSNMNAYDCTFLINSYDKEIIAQNNTDYSSYKIACIGDSITEGVGLEDGTQDIFSYPAVLKKILGAKEVINLGKGGTSISSYWDSFFSVIDGIPQDVDIIIVLGGVNDCYAGNEDNIGNSVDLAMGTFYGDTDFLMRDLKDKYPGVQIIFVTPLSTITNTTYLSFLPNMLPLYRYVDAITELGNRNDINVFNIYHERFLDSNDEEIMKKFMYDGVHPNAVGYQLLAEHMASELIKMNDSSKSNPPVPTSIRLQTEP